MRHLTITAILVCGSTLLTRICAAAAGGPTPDPALDIYAKPTTLVEIGQARHLNLRGTSKRTPTVLLESGAIATRTTHVYHASISPSAWIKRRARLFGLVAGFT